MLLSSYQGTLTDQAKEIVNLALAELIKSYEAEIAKLKARADDTIPAIKTDIQDCDQIGKFRTPESYEQSDYSRYSYTYSVEEVEKRYLEDLDKAHLEVEATHKANIPSIENNKIVREKLEKLMKSIGIPDGYKERDYNTRSYKAKYKTTFGYTIDIARIKINDNYESALESEKRLKERLVEYVRQRKEKVAKEKAEKEAKVLEEKKLIQFGVMAAKYGLRGEVTKEELLDAILEKDKYLRLGHYLSENRNDWSDGYSYAENGLHGFTIETEEDKLIYADISECIEKWDGDGRIFRDTKYSYSVLLSKADSDLFKDYETVNSWINKY